MTGPEPGALHRYIEGLRAERDEARAELVRTKDWLALTCDQRDRAERERNAARAECAAEHAECERLLSACPSGICLRVERSS